MQTPINAVIFDCDGTLSTIEGIDQLAYKNDVAAIVQRLTQDAMGKSGMSIDIYAKRLDLVKPTESDLNQLADTYFATLAEDAIAVIDFLRALQKDIFIVSAGLFPAVSQLAKKLNISSQHVYAVDVTFDSLGQYRDFDRTSPLVIKHGKRHIVEQIKQQHPSLSYIGDGLSDLEVADLVTRFIGYGGAFYRENIEQQCHYYIRSLSLAPLLPLILTKEELQILAKRNKPLYDKAFQLFQEGKIKSPALFKDIF